MLLGHGWLPYYFGLWMTAHYVGQTGYDSTNVQVRHTTLTLTTVSDKLVIQLGGDDITMKADKIDHASPCFTVGDGITRRRCQDQR